MRLAPNDSLVLAQVPGELLDLLQASVEPLSTLQAKMESLSALPSAVSPENVAALGTICLTFVYHSTLVSPINTVKTQFSLPGDIS